MGAQQQTQRGMLETLLAKVFEISEEQTRLGGEIKAIDKTLHNGMSHRIDETHRTVMQVRQDLETYKKSGHLAECPYVKDEAAKKERARKGFLAGWKGTVAFVSLGTGIGVLLSTWSNIVGGV